MMAPRAVAEPFHLDRQPLNWLNYEQLVHCMRCGLCLATCPTYELFHIETASPRGRLALMRAVDEGQLEVSDGFHQAMNLCLGCLACQTACPAGVPYGALLESARGLAEKQQKAKRSPVLNALRSFVLRRLVYSPHGLEFLQPLLRFYQKNAALKLISSRIIPARLRGWEKMLPEVAPRSVHRELGRLVPAAPPRRGRVGLLTGCLQNVLLAPIGMASTRVLAQNGFEVVIPPRQVCCGALPAHLGETELARQQARRNIDIFEEAGVETIISDAGGCSAHLKEYGQLLADDPEYAGRAAAFSRKARDITEYLMERLPLRGNLGPLHLRVTYDDPCHLVHAQNISSQPRHLLQSIPGLEFVELPEASWCCGSAGTYNLTHPHEAEALLKRKMQQVERVRPQVLATANSGCYLQLSKGVKDAGLPVEVRHVVELLDRSYRARNPAARWIESSTMKSSTVKK